MHSTFNTKHSTLFFYCGLCRAQKEDYKSLLFSAIYEQYLLSRMDNGKSPFWYWSASSFRTLSQIGFFPLNNALRYWMPFSSVILTVARQRQDRDTAETRSVTQLRQDRDTAETRSWHSWDKIVTQLRQDRDTAEARSWHSWGKMAFKNLSSIEKETCPNGQVSFFMSCKRDYYSSTAACGAANRNWLSAHYGESWKRLGNIMSMNCTFCSRCPQNIRAFLPLRLLLDILIGEHDC